MARLCILLIAISLLISLAGPAGLAAAAAAAADPKPATKSGQHNPPKQVADEKKEKDCYGTQEGTVLIPGIGRYMIGSHPDPLPEITGLDNSIPAAAGAQYIPGYDDTFVPNPGYEVPNPISNGGSSTP